MSSRDHRIQPDADTCLSERDLAKRWHISQRTLQRWRAERCGPPFLTIGGSIRYPLADILRFEDSRRSTVGDT